MRAPIVRASTSGVTSATWWSPKPTCSITLCAGYWAADRSSCERRSRWPRHGPTAAGFSDRLSGARARWGSCRKPAPVSTPWKLPLRVAVEVDAALEQGRVVHPRHAECRPVVVDAHRREGSADDSALAVAVVVEARGVEDRCGADVERRRSRSRPLAWAHPAGASYRGSEHPLLHPSASFWNNEQVLKDRDHCLVIAVRRLGTAPAIKSAKSFSDACLADRLD